MTGRLFRSRWDGKPKLRKDSAARLQSIEASTNLPRTLRHSCAPQKTVAHFRSKLFRMAAVKMKRKERRKKRKETQRDVGLIERRRSYEFMSLHLSSTAFIPPVLILPERDARGRSRKEDLQRSVYVRLLNNTSSSASLSTSTSRALLPSNGPTMPAASSSSTSLAALE